MPTHLIVDKSIERDDDRGHKYKRTENLQDGSGGDVLHSVKKRQEHGRKPKNRDTKWHKEQYNRKEISPHESVFVVYIFSLYDERSETHAHDECDLRQSIHEILRGGIPSELDLTAEPSYHDGVDFRQDHKSERDKKERNGISQDRHDIRPTKHHPSRKKVTMTKKHPHGGNRDRESKHHARGGECHLGIRDKDTRTCEQ